MASEAAWIVLVGGIVIALLASLRRLHSHRITNGLPPELRASRLIYAERLFRAIGPVFIVARIDRVYRNAAGELVLVELKTRRSGCVYPSDVIELSAQRVALSAQTKESVAEHAYVRTETREGQGSGWHRVQLMRPEQVTALALRRESLLTGKAVARGTLWPENCRTCAFRQECGSSNWLVVPMNASGDAE